MGMQRDASLMALAAAATLACACGDDSSTGDAPDAAAGVDAATATAKDAASASDAARAVDAADAVDAAPMSCEDTVGSWKSDDDEVFVVIETGCILSNVCDLSDGTHVDGVIIDTEVRLDRPGSGTGEIVLGYTFDGDTLTVLGAGPGNTDVVLKRFGAGDSLPDECPDPSTL